MNNIKAIINGHIRVLVKKSFFYSVIGILFLNRTIGDCTHCEHATFLNMFIFLLKVLIL